VFFWLGLGLTCSVGLPGCVGFLGFFPSCFAMGQNEFVFLLILFSTFGPLLGVFSCTLCKTSEFTKTMEMVSSKSLSILFLVNFIQMLAM
jgi:hypothetical protein